MLKFGKRFFRHSVWVTAMLWMAAASACNVPVFRYALERWEADAYEAVVFFRKPLSADQTSLVTRMEKAGADGLANFTVSKVDVSGDVPSPLMSLWQAQDNPSVPWLVVRYPRPAGIEQAAWTGALTAEAVEALLDSPVRRDIAQRLLSGESAVWLLLQRGNKARDDEVNRLVEAELRKLEQSLVLPERSPLDPAVNPDLPLKIAFSIVRVARSDPAESVLLKLLMNWSPRLTNSKEPMLFPIFGRGRVIPPALGSEITAEALRDMAEFLTGPCSCEIKELNPGYDLLLTANWSSLTGYQETLVPEPPPLVGMSQFVANTTNNPAASPAQPEIAPSLASAVPMATRRGNLVRNVAIVLGVGVLMLVVATLVLRARMR